MIYNKIDFNLKRVLITGGAGFVGSNIASYLQTNFPKCEIVIVDSFRAQHKFSNGNLKTLGHFKNLYGFAGELISGDINDEKLQTTIKENYKFDYIFHQAAISDTTAKEQDIMIETNVNSFQKLLDIAIIHNANMIYASSAATYGSSDIFEVGYEKPSNVYGFSKLMMDNIAMKYIAKKPNISIVGLRYFNVFGKNEFFKHSTSSMVLQFALQILSGKTPKLFENSDKIKRDFVYIKDIIQANILSCDPKKSGVFNIGTANPRSFEDIVDILQQKLQINNGKEYIKNPFVKQYQFYTKANIDDAIKYLGYKPNFSLEDAIEDYIKDIKDIYKDEVQI